MQQGSGQMNTAFSASQHQGFPFYLHILQINRLAARLFCNNQLPGNLHIAKLHPGSIYVQIPLDNSGAG
ncbi:hypothetical protein D3C81_2109840 [compost metagenome]